MNPCDVELRLNAYHDDELSPADRAFVDAHLAECPGCRQTLEGLRQTSALFAGAPAPLPTISRARLHQGIDRRLERGLVRLSWAVSGVAAAVMVLGSAWLTRTGEPAPTSTNAVVIQSTPDTGTPAEVYYLADATNRAEDW